MLYMKKTLNDLKIKNSKYFDSIAENTHFPFPFETNFISLLKETNVFPQEYFYLTNNESYAYFILYKMKLNIFTFGKIKLNMNVKIVGIPCSISENGYYTNNEKFMLEFIKTIKGPKLVLNVKKPVKTAGITVGTTLPTCILVNNFQSADEYLSSLRSSYKRRIKKAIKNCKDYSEVELKGNCPKSVYELYLRTYEKSLYKLEKLETFFFDKIEADKIIFSKDNIDLGFVLLKKHQDKLYFMFCGLNYNADTPDLYYYMLYKIIIYAIRQKCKIIDFGQTSEKTKLRMGAELSERYFYAHHSNIFLNFLIKINKRLLEYKCDLKKYHVFKEIQ